MRQYCKLSHIPEKILKEIITYFFIRCDKVNIYFPNQSSLELMKYKETFLKTIDIADLSDELLSLEDTPQEKEGYSMIIASLTEEVKHLILNMDSAFHLSLGLISGNRVLFYVGDEGECIIEDEEDSNMFSSPLFSTFKTI